MRFEPKSRVGMGCWAIGGPFFAGDDPLGYANTDDAQSLAAIEASYEAGIRLFDTADVYGAGHSERLLGQALKGRDDVVISTKFGIGFDETSKQVTGERTDAAYVEMALDASRKRLDRDVLDLVFLHLNSLPPQVAAPLFDALEDARTRGIISAYGWSTDFPQSARALAKREGFVAVQHAMNVFFDAPSMMDVTRQHGLLSFNRSPLAMGLLTGKFTAGQRMAPDDIRHNSFGWMDYFKDGKVEPSFVAMLEAVRDLLTVGGRSPAQGALGWLLAKSPNTVPIPGARTVEQATHNARALDFSPLPTSVMAEIETVLTRPAEGAPRER
jgi:aryl-alcohol dehydrogenase-like predicted oxidoreductase